MLLPLWRRKVEVKRRIHGTSARYPGAGAFAFALILKYKMLDGDTFTGAVLFVLASVLTRNREASRLFLHQATDSNKVPPPRRRGESVAA